MSEEGAEDPGQQKPEGKREPAPVAGAKEAEEQKAPDTSELARKVDAAAWALFFIWIGIALLTNLGLGGAMLGVGLIIIGGLAARWYFRLKVEGMWIVVGVLFVVGGLWGILGITRVPLGPILLIVAGVAILIGALGGMSLFRK